jgi:hypothetical protein
MKIGIAFLCVILIVVGCGNTEPKQITEVRNVSPAPQGMTGMNTAEHPADAPGAVGLPAAHLMPESPFLWTLPEGWAEQTPTSIRIGNFSSTVDPSIECYITLLSGTAGGVAANVNRWHQQMNQPALSEADIQALPLLTILDTPSPYVEIVGDFTGMSGQVQPGYMMLAAVCPLPEDTVFVKMTGPAAAVNAEKDRFKALCSSLIIKGGDHTDGVVEENK